MKILYTEKNDGFEISFNSERWPVEPAFRIFIHKDDYAEAGNKKTMEIIFEKIEDWINKNYQLIQV